MAYEAGVQRIVLSNHGGRQLDTARSGLEVLVEVVPALRARGYFPQCNPQIKEWKNRRIERWKRPGQDTHLGGERG